MSDEMIDMPVLMARMMAVKVWIPRWRLLFHLQTLYHYQTHTRDNKFVRNCKYAPVSFVIPCFHSIHCRYSCFQHSASHFRLKCDHRVPFASHFPAFLFLCLVRCWSLCSGSQLEYFRCKSKQSHYYCVIIYLFTLGSTSASHKHTLIHTGFQNH